MSSTMCKGVDEQETPHWYDDHVFNEFQEEFCDITFKGEHWRRLMKLKEELDITKAFSVKGTTFRKAEIERAIRHARTKGGMRLVLVHEPSNAFDQNAISVEVNSHCVGYVPRDVKIPEGKACHVAKFGLFPNPNVVIAY